jgi:hypothetical protein
MNENRIIWGLSPHIETTQGLASLSMMKLSVRGKGEQSLSIFHLVIFLGLPISSCPRLMNIMISIFLN